MAKAKATAIKQAPKNGAEEIFEGFGILSPKGTVLEAYKADFGYALLRLDLASLKSQLVRVTARLEPIDRKQIREICRKAKLKGD